MRPICLAAAAILALAPPLPADPPDRLAEALSAVSFERSDLGCRPKTWWSRFGHFAGTRRVPFFFPDLFAEPLRTYETSRVMAGAMERYLSPSYRTANEDGAFKTAYFLGFTHLSPAHRGYRAGTADLPADLADPLAAAVEELYRAGGGRPAPTCWPGYGPRRPACRSRCTAPWPGSSGAWPGPTAGRRRPSRRSRRPTRPGSPPSRPPIRSSTPRPCGGPRRNPTWCC